MQRLYPYLAGVVPSEELEAGTWEAIKEHHAVRMKNAILTLKKYLVKHKKSRMKVKAVADIIIKRTVMKFITFLKEKSLASREQMLRAATGFHKEAALTATGFHKEAALMARVLAWRTTMHIPNTYSPEKEAEVAEYLEDIVGSEPQDSEPTELDSDNELADLIDCEIGGMPDDVTDAEAQGVEEEEEEKAGFASSPRSPKMGVEISKPGPSSPRVAVGAAYTLKSAKSAQVPASSNMGPATSSLAFPASNHPVQPTQFGVPKGKSANPLRQSKSQIQPPHPTTNLFPRVDVNPAELLQRVDHYPPSTNPSKKNVMYVRQQYMVETAVRTQSSPWGDTGDPLVIHRALPTWSSVVERSVASRLVAERSVASSLVAERSMGGGYSTEQGAGDYQALVGGQAASLALQPRQIERARKSDGQRQGGGAEAGQIDRGRPDGQRQGGGAEVTQREEQSESSQTQSQAQNQNQAQTQTHQSPAHPEADPPAKQARRSFPGAPLAITPVITPQQWGASLSTDRVGGPGGAGGRGSLPGTAGGQGERSSRPRFSTLQLPVSPQEVSADGRRAAAAGSGAADSYGQQVPGQRKSRLTSRGSDAGVGGDVSLTLIRSLILKDPRTSAGQKWRTGPPNSGTPSSRSRSSSHNEGPIPMAGPSQLADGGPSPRDPNQVLVPGPPLSRPSLSHTPTGGPSPSYTSTGAAMAPPPFDPVHGCWGKYSDPNLYTLADAQNSNKGRGVDYTGFLTLARPSLVRETPPSALKNTGSKRSSLTWTSRPANTTIVAEVAPDHFTFVVSGYKR
eukprot:gene24803-10448_t